MIVKTLKDLGLGKKVVNIDVRESEYNSDIIIRFDILDHTVLMSAKSVLEDLGASGRHNFNFRVDTETGLVHISFGCTESAVIYDIITELLERSDVDKFTLLSSRGGMVARLYDKFIKKCT